MFYKKDIKNESFIKYIIISFTNYIIYLLLISYV
jgi:hypothetical protein